MLDLPDDTQLFRQVWDLPNLCGMSWGCSSEDDANLNPFLRASIS